MELIKNDIEITSLQIAEWSGKRHRDFMRSAKKVLENIGVSARTFARTYFDVQNKEQEMLVLPKRELLIVVSKFDDKLRAKIIDRVLELEQSTKMNIPKELIEQFMPKGGFMEENKKGMIKTKPIRGYWRVDKDSEENRLLQKKYELSKIANGLIDLTREMRSVDRAIRRLHESKRIEKGTDA